MKAQYVNYDAVALAQETDVIHWVREGDKDAEWSEWLEEHPECQAEVSKARELVLAMEFDTQEPTPAQVDNMWSTIDRATREEAQVTSIWQRRRLTLLAAVVAVLLILAGWWALPAPPEIRLVTTTGGKDIYELPDGSVVILNAQSMISYEPDEWPSARRIELTGEAFFDVKKGTPFLVKTPFGDVQVLGTSFDVEARKERFAVACFTGSVRVAAASSSEVLSPGEIAISQGNVLQIDTFEGEKAAAWREGVHYFESTTLRMVFTELERQFEVKVKLPDDLADREYTGFFESGDLNAALEAICWPMDLTFEVNGKRVIISDNS
ncbi:MAG: FecR domain-containing protein [Phaeodactylibacter sp.]|uniref:FecR family protein n=1 Tax=Phaeodactylibacter sp. TaxID=1940289 RepID=UPI0032EC7C07